MHFGEVIDEERYCRCIQHAYEHGIRTFVTADVYGCGKADSLLGKALASFPRETYTLVGAIGHDFYNGRRKGNTGYPRFTDPSLRGPDQYASYLEKACVQSLERCRSDYFDLLFLHNPDELGYTSAAVWEGMALLKQAGLTTSLGIAPGPANGFVLDLVKAFERFE